MALAYFAFGDRCQVRKRHVKDQRLTMELVLDNVGTWNVIQFGMHQHGQLCKHQLGTHKRKLWAGGTREAITIYVLVCRRMVSQGLGEASVGQNT